MPGTHTPQASAYQRGLLLIKKRFHKEPLRARNTRCKQGVATCNLVNKKSGFKRNRWLPGTRLELAHP